MSFEGFDDWDEIFLDQAIRIEEGLIAMSATNPILILDPQSPPPPPSLIASHDFHSFSPPREFSQKFTEIKDPPRPSNGVANISIGNSSPLVRRLGKDKEIEIDRLKRELGRVSKQLTRTEQECMELKKDRTKKEEELKSVFSQIEAKDAEINLLKSINVEYGAIIQDHPGISPQCQNANTSIDQAGPWIDHALTTFKAIGVQTDTSDECNDFTIKNDLSSQHDLSNKLLGIWGSPGGQRSGRNLVSQLFITCATDFHVLFRCISMSMSSKITLDSLADESFSDATFHNHMQSVLSIETVKVSRLYSMLTKISNEMLQLDALFEALLDLCILENDVIVHRSLRIVRVILKHLLSLGRRYDRRDNVMVKGNCSKNNILEFHVPEKAQTGVQFGMSRDETSFSDCISSSMRSYDVDTLFHKGHGNSSNLTSVGCLDWFSLFEKMHRIIMRNTEEGIRVEAVSIMNLILMRSNPYMEREKYALTVVFETVSQLLRKEAGLRVQKQAVHLLFLLLNCPKLLMMFCSDKDNEESTEAAADGAKDASVFRGFSILLEGLAECVACSGNGTQELKLRRHAIIVLAFVASSGKSGFEVLLSQGLSKQTNFLELIVRVLASEMDAEAAELAEPPEICKERTSLLREALILLNRLASNPIYSTAALGALTSSREMTSLVIDVANRMSRKGKRCWKSDSTKKMQMREFEIVELARIFRTRVFTYLGNSIS